MKIQFIGGTKDIYQGFIPFKRENTEIVERYISLSPQNGIGAAIDKNIFEKFRDLFDRFNRNNEEDFSELEIINISEEEFRGFLPVENNSIKKYIEEYMSLEKGQIIDVEEEVAWRLISEQSLDFIPISYYYYSDGWDISDELPPYYPWKRATVIEEGGTNYIKEFWVEQSLCNILYAILWCRHSCIEPDEMMYVVVSSSSIPDPLPFYWRPEAQGRTNHKGEVWVWGTGAVPSRFITKIYWDVDFWCLPSPPPCPSEGAYFRKDFRLEDCYNNIPRG